MRYKKIMMLAILLVALLTVSAVNAADNTTSDIVSMEDTNDEFLTVEDNHIIEQSENEGTLGAKDDGTFTALQKKIDDADEYSTITLENDYYNTDGFNKEGIVISKSLTIDGKGHTIDAKKLSRIFTVETYSGLSLKNINFVNGNAGDANDGGAILFNYANDAEISGCSFRDNIARSGGAIYTSGKNLDFSDCNFINDRASYLGGAVCIGYNSRNYHFNDCSFISCSAGGSSPEASGAIYSQASDLFISSCEFSNGFGGALEVTGKTKVVNCNFINYTCIRENTLYSGIPIVRLGGYGSNMSYCNFIDNFGGIMLSFGGDGGTLSNCDFRNNRILNEVLIVKSYKESSIYKCNFIDNEYNYDSLPVISISPMLFSSTSGYNNLTIRDIVVKDYTTNMYGDAVTVEDNILTITTSTSAKGQITVRISDKTFTKSVSSGIAQFDLSGLNSGTYQANIYYSGDNYEYVASEMNIPITIESKYKYKLTSSDVSKYYGGPEKYTVTLTENDKALANENVKFTLNGKTYTKTTDSKGQASIDLDLPVGNYDVSASYGDASTKDKAYVYSTIDISDVRGIYSNTKVTATFLNTNGMALASKQVTFEVGDKEYPATTDSNGVATANIDLDAGTYIVTAINPVNNEQKSANLEIKAKTKITSQKTTVAYNDGAKLVATLTNEATGKAIANANIVFKINDVKHTVKTDSKGQAKLSLNGLNPDDYTAIISYAGNSKYASSTKSVKVIVNKAGTSISATINDNELVATLTHGVTGKAISGAKIVANINGEDYSLKTDSDGQASFYVDSDTVPAIVSYAGNAKYNPSAATVNTKANMVISAVYDADGGEILVTLTNEVTGNAVSSTTLQVNLNGAVTTVKTNTKGEAKVSTAGLPLGTNTATISYAGNSKYNPASTSISFDVKTKVIITDIYADSDKFLAKLTNGATGSPIANANMEVTAYHVSDRGYTIAVKKTAKSDSKGQISLNTADLWLKNNEVKISYAGNSRYTPSSVTTTLDINKANMMITYSYNANKKKLTATLKNSQTGNAVSNANMVVDVNGVQTTLKSNSKGQITFSTAGFDSGTYVGTVTYGGNAKYNPISAAFKAVV